MQVLIHKAGPYDVEQFPCRQYAGPADLKAPRAGVLHTTEGSSLPLAEFRTHYSPHFTISSCRIVQLLPIGASGAATRAHNNLAICQIELVGFSNAAPWLPDAESAKRLAAVMATMHHLFGVPLSHPWPDGDFGKAGHNPHRASGKFGKIAGWYGHGDMPDPDAHWDPGALQWSKLFDLARGFEAVPQDPQEPTGHS